MRVADRQDFYRDMEGKEMSEERKDRRTSQADKEMDEKIDRLYKEMFDYKPYDRELFEKMMPDERKAYNNAFKLTGVILLIGGILWFLFNTLLGDGRGWCLLMMITGICMLCYWRNPFCFSNLWKAIVKLLTWHNF